MNKNTTEIYTIVIPKSIGKTLYFFATTKTAPSVSATEIYKSQDAKAIPKIKYFCPVLGAAA